MTLPIIAELEEARNYLEDIEYSPHAAIIGKAIILINELEKRVRAGKELRDALNYMLPVYYPISGMEPMDFVSAVKATWKSAIDERLVAFDNATKDL